MFRRFKYRLFPSKKQIKLLDQYLISCRLLYNKLLQLEIDEYNQSKKFIFYIDLCRITQKEIGLHSQVKQNIAKRLEDALRFYLKRKTIEKTGFPRFKSKNRYKSWIYPQFGRGFKFDERYLKLPYFGRIKAKKHRELFGKIKTCCIKKEIDKWFVIFVTEQEDKQIVRIDKKEVGIDLGCKDLVTLSTGEKVKNPKYLKKVLNKISKLESIKESTKNIKKKDKLYFQMWRLYRRSHNQREDFIHKLTTKLCKEYSHIYIEDLPVNKMVSKAKGKSLRKSIKDTGWNSIMRKLTYKVEETGSKLIKVDPKNTTKMCSECGKLIEKSLRERIHHCSCGLVMDRDLNAAINILRLGQKSLDLKS